MKQICYREILRDSTDRQNSDSFFYSGDRRGRQRLSFHTFIFNCTLPPNYAHSPRPPPSGDFID